MTGGEDGRSTIGGEIGREMVEEEDEVLGGYQSVSLSYPGGESGASGRSPVPRQGTSTPTKKKHPPKKISRQLVGHTLVSFVLLHSLI